MTNQKSGNNTSQLIALIGRLLDYPELGIELYRDDLMDIVTSSVLSKRNKKEIISFIDRCSEMPLLDWQSDYDGLFERGRSLSLLIYEHIHGESRDRGQAMVDLLAQYEKAGLEIAHNELPDHLPLFLEFSSTQGEQGIGWIEDIIPVLSLLAVRLEKRESGYASLMWGLLDLCGAKVNISELREQVKNEKEDHTPKELDKVWEEEAVTFGGDSVNGGCPTNQHRPTENQRKDQEVPVNWMSMDETASATQTKEV
ncbi:nitrate reductase molybdenum cofactor assembly chaperone [Salinivibrio sp. MA607]|uniref:nitrate reductase molybdenum cofactor assembly chaperone n=1 Tax=Salinivibrio sp. MA607 TaxID=1909457 RepID=UPI0009895656|nr:nitrate reductase molybdenum cofactor assembly chaperone [Salinivibrio sp. MA607]OOF02120.1 nitrate reductase molybdenum cofactor assembly chaperone [Salinivibrio sp. MA607]